MRRSIDQEENKSQLFYTIKIKEIIGFPHFKYKFEMEIKDPYEGCRPIPQETSFKTDLNDDLNSIGVGKVQSTNNVAFSVCLKIDQLEVQLDKIKENIENKEQQIYEQVMKLGKEGTNTRAPQKNNEIINHVRMSTWRLATDQGRMLDCMDSKWTQALMEIELYAKKQSGANFKIIQQKNENIEEENHNMQNLLHILEIENTTQGFQALLFFAKLHFIDCIFTSGVYPKPANRNNEYSMFLYPFEWEISYENIEQTTFVQLEDCTDPENNNRSENNDILIDELLKIKKKIKYIRKNSVYNLCYKVEREHTQFNRVKDFKKITRVQNMQCYIGYRIHYHLLQMLGRKNITEKEYFVIGQRKNLKTIAELTDCYSVHDFIKRLNLNLIKISNDDIKMQLDSHVLMLKAIVEKEEINDCTWTIVKAMYPTYLIKFSEWKDSVQNK